MKAEINESGTLAVNVFDLDQSAIIYPNIGKPTLNQVFRVEAELDENIDYEILKKALERVKQRMPTFFVKLYKSRFNYQLCQLDSIDGVIIEQSDVICHPFDLTDFAIPLLRVTYKKDRLGAEFFHSVTDGNGGTVFLKTLISEYYKQKGENIPEFDGILNCDEKPKDEEVSDAFLKVFESGGKIVSRAESIAFQYGTKKAKKPLEIFEFHIPMDEFKAMSKRYNSTVTQMFVAIYTSAFCNSDEGRETKKSIKISVPIDLRTRFPATSLRNFSLYMNSDIKPKSKNADSIKGMLTELKKQFVEKTDKHILQDMAYTNVKQAKMALFKAAPRSLKKTILALGNTIYGERLFTSSMSNLNSIDLPDELQAHIKAFRFIIGETMKNNINSTVSTYKGNINFVISARVDATEIIDYIKDFLNKEEVNFTFIDNE